MNKQELNEFFLSSLENGNIYIVLAKGKAKYKMSRGSFKTKDHAKDKHKLVFKKKDNNDYIFSDGKEECIISVECDERITLKFKTDSSFNRFTLRFKSFEDEHIYGCGEQYTHFDLKGQNVDIWVSEHQQVLKIAKKFLREKILGVNPSYKAPYKDHQTYFSSPGFMSSKNYFIYCHQDSFGRFSFKKDETLLSFRQIPEKISILLGDNPLDLISHVTRLVKIQPHLPAFVGEGAILATQGGTDVMMKKYKAMKEKGAKIAAIWCQDWSGQIITEFGSQVYWNWEHDTTLYHDLDKAIEELNRDNVKFLGYINTFLKQDANLYNYAKEHDFLVKNKYGNPYLIKSTTFYAGIVDLTNPKAYQWYKDIIKKNMIGKGLSGWMADFGEYLPTDSIVYGGDAEKLHNKWPTLWAKCNLDAIKEAGKEGEIFIFSRAAYGDTIQYTTSMWNGDQHVDYSNDQGLGSVIPATLSMCCSGVGVNHSDIGGYTTVLHMKRDEELFLRWSEMNIFTPVYRCHEGNRPKSNVQFDDESVIDEFCKNSNIFYELKPYREYVLNEYYEKGIPVNRPLFFHFDEEECYTTQKEFMFGEELLVAPVLRPKVKKLKVFLPKGNWIGLFDGIHYKGGEQEVDAPRGKPIAFYLEGTKHQKLFEKFIKEK
ncbi:MAG: alpha-glucosidase [Bacilli bacterium]|nr:alpha-glucosidase [Bacilli bacterium]